MQTSVPAKMIRVHLLDEGAMDRVKAFVMKTSPDEHLMVREDDASREHVHILMWTAVARSTLTTRLTAAAGAGGNGAFSVKSLGETPDDLLNVKKYLCKGVALGVLPDVVMTTYESDKIQLWHEMYWKTNDEMKKSAKEKKKAQKGTKMEMLIDAKVVTSEMTWPQAVIAVTEYAVEENDVYVMTNLRTISKILYAKTRSDKLQRRDVIRMIAQKVIEDMNY